MTSSMSDRPPTVIVNPRFAIEWRDISDFLGEFGPYNGRYVPRYPSDWVSQLVDHVKNELPPEPVKRAGILERLRKGEAQLCTAPAAWPWEGAQSWAHNIEVALQREPSSVVVGDALDPSPFFAWSDAIDEIRETRRRSWPFHGTIGEYIDFCSPLLVNSPSVYLVDPYLDLFSDVAENLIRSLFAVAKGSKCYALEIITRRSSCAKELRPKDAPPFSFREIEDRMSKTYTGLVPRDRVLKLHLVEEGSSDSDALRLHDRFFLTMHGSIQFGQGFKSGNRKLPQQNAFITEKNHHSQLKRIYIDGVARHAERLPRVSGVSYPINVSTAAVTG